MMGYQEKWVAITFSPTTILSKYNVPKKTSVHPSLQKLYIQYFCKVEITVPWLKGQLLKQIQNFSPPQTMNPYLKKV